MNPSLRPTLPASRADMLKTISNNSLWDVIVIGGGATGLGTAVDAAARGYRTLLIEAEDFAKGTSSKATKLVHGGVRYLAQGNISLVREALHERGLLHQNAPHLVWPLGFVVPAFGVFDQPFYGTGLKMYDVLAGKRNLSPSRCLTKQEILAHVPNIAQSVEGRRLRGGNLYYDGQFDDARLAISLMRTLFDLDGLALNYLRVTGLLRSDPSSPRRAALEGVVVHDSLSGTEHIVRGRCIINATGVWVDNVRRMDDNQAQNMVAPSQGVHLTLPRDFLPGNKAILIPKTRDGRVLFMVPWNGHTIVGTTDTPRHDLPLEPKATSKDIDFILSTAGRYLSRKPSRADITSIWAGLRPLVKESDKTATKTLSREHTILVSNTGLVTVTGGKWTTYRKMAQDVIDTAIQHQLLPQAHCRTEHLRLHGAGSLAPLMPDTTVAHGTPDSYYGTDLPLLRTLPGLDNILVKSSGLTEAHVRFAARYELARTVEDVLARRNRALFLNSADALLAATDVARILAEELELDSTWQHDTITAFKITASGYRAE